MIIKRIGLPLVLATLFLSPLVHASADAAQTSPAAASQSCPCEHKGHKLIASLQLTDDQQTKIRAIKDATKNASKAWWQQMAAITTQINAITTSDKVDEAKLDELIKQKTDLFSKIMKARVVSKNQIYHVLNAQQQQQFAEMLKEWQGKKHSHANCACAKH